MVKKRGAKRRPWNKGLEVGKKGAFTPAQVKRMLFQVAIDTMLHVNRLLKCWIAEAGLDPKKYGNESLRRTKALHILKGTGDLEMVRMLLGHAKDRINGEVSARAHNVRPNPN
jgi:site-specific recombinase XerD